MQLSVQEDGINSLSDLEGQRVCVAQGTTAEEYFIDNHLLTKYQVLPKASVSAAADAFFAGTCDAVVTDGPLLKAMIVERQAQGLFDSKVMDQILRRESYGFYIQAGHSVLYEALKAAMYATQVDEDQLGVMSRSVCQPVSQVVWGSN